MGDIHAGDIPMNPRNGSPERPGDVSGGPGGPPGPAGENPLQFSSPPVQRSQRRRKKRGPGGNRKKGKMFMDTVDQAFVHQVVVSLWRDFEAYLAASPSIEEALARLKEEECFEARGDFAPVWKKNWLEALGKIEPATPSDTRLEVLRQAVVESMEEENALRAEKGMPAILDEREGQNFITFTIERILHEADGEIEEIEDDD